MPATAGHDVLLAYDWEDSFRTAPGSADKKPWGHNATLDTKEGSNEAVRLFEPGDPEAIDAIEQQFAGSWSVSFVLTNPWFFRAIIDAATSSGTSPTTHSFDGFPGDSMEIYTGKEPPGGTDVYRTLTGCVVQSATITWNIPGVVEVTLDGAYAKESETSSFTQPTLDYRALAFQDGRLNRGGTDLDFVQSLQVSIELNTDMILELGDRYAADYSPKRRNTSIEYARIVQNTDDQQRAYGGASSLQDNITNEVDFVAEASNGKSGSDENTIKVQLDNVFPDSVSRSGIGDGSADLEDELSELATVDNNDALRVEAQIGRAHV